MAQSPGESSTQLVGIARMLSNVSNVNQPASNENVPPANPVESDIQGTVIDSSASTILHEEPSSQIIVWQANPPVFLHWRLCTQIRLQTHL